MDGLSKTRVVVAKVDAVAYAGGEAGEKKSTGVGEKYDNVVSSLLFVFPELSVLDSG